MAYSGNKRNIEGFVLSTFDFIRLDILLIEETMRAVMREKVAGDGGKIGREILASLKISIKSKEVVE